MKPFCYAAPRTLDEAVTLMAQAKGEAKPLVGGTDLLTQIRKGLHQPSMVVDVKGIPEANRLEFVSGEGLHIGSAVSYTHTASYGPLQEFYPAIWEACLLVGPIHIRNRASIGGNICNASPAADTVSPLLVYEAQAVIAGPHGRRQVSLEDFFLGPGQTVLAPDELLVEVVVPPPPAKSSSMYLSFTLADETDIAVVGVGSLVVVSPEGRHYQMVRISLTAVAPIPMRAREAEAFLEGKECTEEFMHQAGELAAQASRPISDLRGTAEYRRKLVKLLTRDTLAGCLVRLGMA